MSSHFQSSGYASSHFASNHYAREILILITPEDGGSSDPAQIAKRIAPRVKDPVLRAKLLREDEEILQIILSCIEVLDQ